MGTKRSGQVVPARLGIELQKRESWIRRNEWEKKNIPIKQRRRYIA